MTNKSDAMKIETSLPQKGPQTKNHSASEEESQEHLDQIAMEAATRSTSRLRENERNNPSDNIFSK